MAEFNNQVNLLLARLIREAAINRMSPEDVARAGHMTPKRVRALMRSAGLNPRYGKTLLSKQAAEALAGNAELLGVKPNEIDLMSPLAYLPAGDAVRREVIKARTAVVTELDDYVPTHYQIDFALVAERFQKLAARGGVVIEHEHDLIDGCGATDVRLEMNENDEPIISRESLAFVLGVEL